MDSTSFELLHNLYSKKLTKLPRNAIAWKCFEFTAAAVPSLLIYNLLISPFRLPCLGLWISAFIAKFEGCDVNAVTKTVENCSRDWNVQRKNKKKCRPINSHNNKTT